MSSSTLTSSQGRIADNDIKARAIARKHLGKRQRPVQCVVATGERGGLVAEERGLSRDDRVPAWSASSRAPARPKGLRDPEIEYAPGHRYAVVEGRVGGAAGLDLHGRAIVDST